MNTNNNIGEKITQEQIDLINKFKEDYKIDTDEKFIDIITNWNLIAHTNIVNKIDLARASRTIVQNFIDWVNSVKSGESSETEFITPSSDQTGFVW